MLKGFQNTNNSNQFLGFTNLNMQQSASAYGYAGVNFWLDASYGLNTQTNFGAVSRWQTRVGGVVFEQNTAGNQPRLILNDTNYNNYPCVQSVDGVRSMNALFGLGLQINTTGITIAVVSKNDSILGNNTIIAEPLTNEYGIADGGLTSGFNGFGYYRNFPFFVPLQGTTESLNARIKIITGTNVIVNGINESSGSIGLVGRNLTRIFLQTGGNALYGSIAEIVAFPYTMNAIQAIDLCNRINQKYAIY